MYYKYIRGNEVIARVMNDFTIDNSQWIYSAPLWMMDGLSKLSIPTIWQYAYYPITVSAYKFQLPCDLKLLIAIEYDSMRLRRRGTLLNMSAEGLESKGFASDNSYELLGDGWIGTSFEEGDIVVHYRRPLCDYDKERDILIPKIPDNPFAIEALEWYLLLSILRKGFKHPVFDLNSKVPYTNPATMWETMQKRARNSLSSFDADERHEISILARTFILDVNAHSGIFFNGSSNGASGTNPGVSTTAIITSESITNTYNTIINSEIPKYVKAITNLSTEYIPATEHGLGVNVVPTLFELVNGEYVKTVTVFTVDLNGNVTWTGSSTIVNGYIVII